MSEVKHDKSYYDYDRNKPIPKVDQEAYVKKLQESLDDDHWYSWDAPSNKFVDQADTTKEHTGGSSSYYKLLVRYPNDPDQDSYWAECLDIIETLEMTFSEGNAFKALWRKAAARQGKEKEGNTALYDAEKVRFFGNYMVQQEINNE